MFSNQPCVGVMNCTVSWLPAARTCPGALKARQLCPPSVVRYSVSAVVLTLKTVNQPSSRLRKNTLSELVQAVVTGPIVMNDRP